MSRGDFDVLAAAGPYRVQKDGRRRGIAHRRFADAEAAALHLVEANPGETFIITREVARVGRHQP
ncbi:hypothetical protein [Sphingomonas sp. BK235]|uniref:hypothetical protein n=1 Tax=Sphingomonas sp. BK235 TaxID=2512131 RepID=UPI00105232F9|nr:hypothetical protein [Sphingomonas sp. BK235]TCP36526.1 hypothetical protein EV292_10122 [Sphingomonas sp. BK235]